MTIPFIGATVQYWPNKAKDPGPYAALITAIIDDHTVTISVFDDAAHIDGQRAIPLLYEHEPIPRKSHPYAIWPGEVVDPALPDAVLGALPAAYRLASAGALLATKKKTKHIMAVAPANVALTSAGAFMAAQTTIARRLPAAPVAIIIRG